jgi:hypothetical protein
MALCGLHFLDWPAVYELDVLASTGMWLQTFFGPSTGDTHLESL